MAGFRACRRRRRAAVALVEEARALQALAERQRRIVLVPELQVVSNYVEGFVRSFLVQYVSLMKAEKTQ